LGSLIAPDGHVRYSRDTDQTPVWVTAQAVMALAGKALPLAPVRAPTAVRSPAAHATHSVGRHVAKVSHRQKRVRRAAARATNSRAVDALFTDVGVVSALALAPAGQG
jgi:hypothetical protein